MKKKFTLSVLGVAVTSLAIAQSPITINGFPAPTSPIQVAYSATSATGIATPAAGANMTWDYSGLTAQGILTMQLLPGTHAQAPGANLVIFNLMTDLVPNYGYEHEDYLTLNTNHLATISRRIPAQTYSMAPATGVNTDTLTIPEQMAVLSSPEKHTAYPMTFGSVWHSDYHVSLQALVDVSPFMLNNAPMEKRTYITTADSVIGWGTMKVPTLMGGASLAYPVLMVKSSKITVDSLFLNGNPAPAQLVAALGQTQGQISYSNSHRFYRQGNVMPLVQFDYTGNTFAQPNQVTYDRSAQGPSSIAGNLNADVQLYPNPSNGTVFVSGLTAGEFTFSLTDLAGRLVYSSTISGSDAGTKVNLPASVAGGFYVWQVAGENGQLLNTGKVSIQK